MIILRYLAFVPKAKSPTSYNTVLRETSGLLAR